jgi:hypothetical protein
MRATTKKGGGLRRPGRGLKSIKKQTTEHAKNEPRKADNLLATKADSSICSQHTMDVTLLSL